MDGCRIRCYPSRVQSVALHILDRQERARNHLKPRIGRVPPRPKSHRRNLCGRVEDRRAISRQHMPGILRPERFVPSSGLRA